MIGKAGMMSRRSVTVSGEVPGAPTNLSLTGDIFWDDDPETWFDEPTARSNGRITASWSAPENDGGLSITGYVVQITNYLSETSTFTVSAVEYQITGVKWATNSCTTSTVSVTAVNAAGAGPPATATIRLPRANAPTLRINSKTPESGAPGLIYVVQWSPECMQSWTDYQVQYRRASVTADGTTTTFDETEEPWGNTTTVDDEVETATISIGAGGMSETYKFRVRAVSQSANSDWSNVVEE